ncbi:MAG: PorV/PorQ family protein [Calditrichia bacterium]|nr:PorV/PorQ family protein [Calditrichia bacterium]
MSPFKIFIFTVFLIFTFVNLYGGDLDRIGTAGGVQVLVPVGGRLLAMGGADAARVRGLEAIYWNPAGLAAMGNRATGLFSTMNILSDVRVNFIALGVHAGGFGTLGFSLKAFDFGDIPVTTIEDMEGESGRTYSPTFVTAVITYSRMLTDVIQVGVNGKLIHESIPRVSASAFAFDAGLQYHGLFQVKGLSLGLVIKNIGTNMQYSGTGLLKEATETELGFEDFRSRETASDQLPSTVELGLSYGRNFSTMNQVIVAGTFQNNNFESDHWKVGTEYTYNNLVFLRMGYLFTQETSRDDLLYTFSAGLGIHTKVGGTDLTFDYAFRDSQYFNGNNLFSLMIGF